MTEELEKTVQKLCGMLLIKCVTEETMELGLNGIYENKGANNEKIKCKFDFKYEIIGVEEND